MFKNEILAEMQRLRVYKFDLEKNLPKVVIEHDNGYKVAQNRLQELNAMLMEAEKEEATRTAEQQMKEAKSTEVLKGMIEDLRKVVKRCEAKQKDLQPSAMGRYFELVTSLKKELR